MEDAPETQPDYPCPKCGRIMDTIPGTDGYLCPVCLVGYSGTAMAMIAYPPEDDETQEA